MAFFAPYLDDKGVHLPTYEDRLASLSDEYRSIYGAGSELSAAVPDYQLLSVFSRALDDASALTLQAFNARNPMYATGAALDQLLPLYNMTREAGESDASLRARIWKYLRGNRTDPYCKILDAVRKARNVREAKLYINDTDTANADGIPAHTLAVVTRGGTASAIAQAIWDTKPPGTATWGSTSASAVDTAGVSRTVYFTRYSDKMIFIYIFIRLLDRGDETVIREAVIPAVNNYVNSLPIAVPLSVPQLYGVIYSALPDLADTFVVTDIQVAVPGATSITRGVIEVGWKEKVTVINDGGTTINFVT